ESVNYNIPLLYQLQEEPDRERLQEAFEKLIKRHESFRTTFAMTGDEPVQQIQEQAEFQLEYYEQDQLTAPGRAESEGKDKLPGRFVRPFNLTQAPLLRAGVIKTGKTGCYLIVDMHHIISDGTSVEIFENELPLLYETRELPPIKTRYKDYCRWQRLQTNKEKKKHQKNYWLDQFQGEIPLMELPLDFARPTQQDFKGKTLPFRIDTDETAAIKKLATKEQTTLYTILTALWTIFLAKLSRRETIILGTAAAGRGHADLENIIGMFINTLARKLKPSGEKTVIQHIRETAKTTLDAFENQEYQFEELVEHLTIEREAGRNPLFDVIFVLHNMKTGQKETRELQLTPQKYYTGTAKFDITISAEESGNGITFDLEYRTTLFKEETIKRFIHYFKQIVQNALQHPQQKINEIEIISNEEKEKILFDFNETGTTYPKDKTIHELFRQQARQNPDRSAMVGIGDTPVQGHHTLTYRELNEASNRQARAFKAKGVKQESIVAIMAESTPQVITAILAILKAGGAYMPLNVNYPAERIRMLLKDSKAGILITSLKNTPAITFDGEIICMDGPGKANTEKTQKKYDEEQTLPPTTAAYIIYTSGSTGKPKGVLVQHRNVVRLVKKTDYVTFNTKDRILQTGALEFDASTFEIWGSILNGLTLHLAENKSAVIMPDSFNQIILKHGITILFLTTALFNQLSQTKAGLEALGGLRVLLTGGEVLSTSHMMRVRKKYPRLLVSNVYGPTENTTFSTKYLIEKNVEEGTPIGSPISNSTAYIVDKNLQLLPVGVPGELVVGGDGVARGYLNNPELTAEKFIKTDWQTEANGQYAV
ncbi:MAG: amino acid adenylation domain-containing protein, partial [bacterium]|nr:amino acid adenylation domain-containing protein [bacterium]